MAGTANRDAMEHNMKNYIPAAVVKLLYFRDEPFIDTRSTAWTRRILEVRGQLRSAKGAKEVKSMLRERMDDGFFDDTDYEQAQEIVGMIDDIIVGNAFASEDELASMAACDLTRTTVTVRTSRELCANERLALTGFAHCGRADASAYFIRSSWPRMAFKEAGAGDAGAGMMSVEGAQVGADKSIPAVPCEKSCFTRGDVLVVNDNLKHYRGEVEVALCDIPNDGERNLVGRIPDEELMILDCMERNPDHFFGFIVK